MKWLLEGSLEIGNREMENEMNLWILKITSGPEAVGEDLVGEDLVEGRFGSSVGEVWPRSYRGLTDVLLRSN